MIFHVSEPIYYIFSNAIKKDIDFDSVDYRNGCVNEYPEKDNQGTNAIESVDASLVNIEQILRNELADGGFSASVTGAFAGALLAYFFTIAHWKTTRKKERVDSVKAAMIEAINKLSTNSYSYWMKDFSLISEKECELNMQTIFKPLYSYYNFIKYNNNNFISLLLFKKKGYESRGIKECESMLAAIYEVFDLATGDDFLEPKRERNEVKAKEIVRACQFLEVKVNCIG